jgi:phosphatidylglycerol---prolipoprotein diacylglyceryl transferase
MPPTDWRRAQSTSALPEARDILAGVLALAMSSPGAIAFQIGPIVIRWYGILMATSIVVGLWIGYRQAKREGLPADDIISVGQWAILAGLVGARLYEVIFNWDYYGRYPAKIVAVWEGGLAMHGGLIVGPLVGVWLARRWNVPILRGLDVTGPSMVLGQAIGRWGNFFNEEAFGRPTDLPWKLYISPEHRPLGYAQYEYFHPTFLYESIWDFVVFLMLVGWLRPRLRGRPGALFFAYIGLYSIGRFAIEALRLDSFWLGSLRVPQLASVAGMLVAVIGMAWTNRRSASPVTG